MKNSEKTRRDVLKLMGVAAGSTLLAACDTSLVSDTPFTTAGARGRTFYVAKNGSGLGLKPWTAKVYSYAARLTS